MADTVSRIGPYNKNINVSTDALPLESATANAVTGRIASLGDSHLSDLITGTSDRIKTRAHFWDLAGEPINRGPLASRAYFQALTGIESEIFYLEGQHPTDSVEVVDGVRTVEVSIHEGRVTRKHGDETITLKVGDVIDSYSEPRGLGSTDAVSEPRGFGLVQARITGIFREIDPEAQFWLGFPAAILEPMPPDIFEGRDLPLVLFGTWDGILDGVGPANAGLPGNFNWIFFTDADALNNSKTVDIINRMELFDDLVNKEVARSLVLSGLGTSFSRLQTKITFVRIPMFLLAALTVAVVAYYLVLVSGILARRRESDTVMLRSRGLSVLQMLRMQALEALVIIGIPAALAPVIALVAVWQMGRLPVFDALTAGTLPVEMTWKAWAFAAAAGFAAFLVMLAPALAAARRGVSENRAGESRPDRPPVFQRYYFDIIFLVLGGLVWWELNARGSVVAATRDGERTADFTLLFAPAIFLLVVALVFLRVFPPVARLISGIAGRSGSAPVAMGFWRLGRRPYWYSWPIMLLVLAGGLGVLAGTLASTLERSNREQIFYETGTDIRVLPSGGARSITTESLESIRQIDGVTGASRAMRQQARFGTTGSGPSFRVLAVDAIEFPKAAWFRDDFAEVNVQQLLRQIHVPVKPEPILLPPGAEQLTMYARQEPFVEDHFLWIILRDHTGRTSTATLSQISDVWTRQTAPVPEVLEDPIELISIQTFMQVSGDGGAPTTLFIDDLTAIGPQGEELILDFETPDLWATLPTSNGLDTLYAAVPEDPGVGPAGDTMARIWLDRGTDSGVRGIYRTATAGPLPVIASHSLLFQTSAQIGVPFVASIAGGFVPLVVVDTLKFFPTLDPDREPFVLIDINSLLEFVELRGLRQLGANEMYLSIDTSQHERITNEIRQVFRAGRIIDRQDLLDESAVDPLAVAGWRGMGVIALILTGIATPLGYITYLSAHSRATQQDSAYMRAMGLSTRDFLRMVVIEHGLIAVIGVVLGVLTGLGISRVAVSSLAFTESGNRLLPPFILQTNWAPVGIVLAIAAATALLVLFRVTRAYPRLPIHVLTRTRE